MAVLLWVGLLFAAVFLLSLLLPFLKTDNKKRIRRYPKQEAVPRRNYLVSPQQVSSGVSLTSQAAKRQLRPHANDLLNPVTPRVLPNQHFEPPRPLSFAGTTPSPSSLTSPYGRSLSPLLSPILNNAHANKNTSEVETVLIDKEPLTAVEQRRSSHSTLFVSSTAPPTNAPFLVPQSKSSPSPMRLNSTSFPKTVAPDEHQREEKFLTKSPASSLQLLMSPCKQLKIEEETENQRVEEEEQEEEEEGSEMSVGNTSHSLLTSDELPRDLMEESQDSLTSKRKREAKTPYESPATKLRKTESRPQSPKLPSASPSHPAEKRKREISPSSGSSSAGSNRKHIVQRVIAAYPTPPKVPSPSQKSFLSQLDDSLSTSLPDSTDKVNPPIGSDNHTTLDETNGATDETSFASISFAHTSERQSDSPPLTLSIGDMDNTPSKKRKDREESEKFIFNTKREKGKETTEPVKSNRLGRLAFSTKKHKQNHRDISISKKIKKSKGSTQSHSIRSSQIDDQETILLEEKEAKKRVESLLKSAADKNEKKRKKEGAKAAFTTETEKVQEKKKEETQPIPSLSLDFNPSSSSFLTDLSASLAGPSAAPKKKTKKSKKEKKSESPKPALDFGFLSSPPSSSSSAASASTTLSLESMFGPSSGGKSLFDFAPAGDTKKADEKSKQDITRSKTPTLGLEAEKSKKSKEAPTPLAVFGDIKKEAPPSSALGDTSSIKNLFPSASALASGGAPSIFSNVTTDRKRGELTVPMPALFGSHAPLDLTSAESSLRSSIDFEEINKSKKNTAIDRTEQLSFLPKQTSDSTNQLSVFGKPPLTRAPSASSVFTSPLKGGSTAKSVARAGGMVVNLPLDSDNIFAASLGSGQKEGGKEYLFGSSAGVGGSGGAFALPSSSSSLFFAPREEYEKQHVRHDANEQQQAPIKPKPFQRQPSSSKTSTAFTRPAPKETRQEYEDFEEETTSKPPSSRRGRGTTTTTTSSSRGGERGGYSRGGGERGGYSSRGGRGGTVSRGTRGGFGASSDARRGGYHSGGGSFRSPREGFSSASGEGGTTRGGVARGASSRGGGATRGTTSGRSRGAAGAAGAGGGGGPSRGMRGRGRGGAPSGEGSSKSFLSR